MSANVSIWFDPPPCHADVIYDSSLNGLTLLGKGGIQLPGGDEC